MTKSLFHAIQALVLLLASGAPFAVGGAASAVPTVAPAVTDETLRDVLKRVQAGDIVRNPRPAIGALPELIRRAERDRDIQFEEIVAARQTLAYARTYDNDAAGGIADLDRLAAELGARGGVEPLLNETLRRKAVILSSLKRYDEAVAINLDVLGREDRAGRDTSALSSATLNALAVIRARQGKYVEGEAFARRATAVGRAAADAKPQAVGDAWRTWVVLLGLADRTNEALVQGQRALAYAESQLGEANETTTGAMNNLASNLADVGRYAEAEALQRRLIDIERAQITTQDQSLAIYLANFGDTLMAQGKAVEAETVLRRARDMMLPVVRPQRPDQLGTFTLNLGNAVYALGRRAEALELFRTALAELARDVGTQHPSWARAQLEVGKLLLDQGDIAGARTAVDAARLVMESRLDPLNHLRLTADLVAGEARVRGGEPGGYAIARSAIASERAVLVGSAIDPLRSALMARERLSSFTRFARLALERGELADAFEALQLAQLSDLDSAGAAWAAQQAAESPELGRALANVRAAANALKQLQADRGKAVAGANSDGLATIDRDIEAAQARSALLAQSLSASHPAYVNLLRPEPRSLAAVKAALKSDQALLLAVPDDRGGVITMIVTTTVAAGQSVILENGKLAQLVDRIRSGIDRGLEDPAKADFDAAASHALFKAMVPPRLDLIARSKAELLVQTGGALASVPMAALLTARPHSALLHGAGLRDAPWLIRRQALSRPVSLATLGLRKPATGVTRFAGIGAPTLGGAAGASAPSVAIANLRRGAVYGSAIAGALPPLPAAAAELRAMAKAFGATSALLLLGQDASRSRVLAEDLRPYTVIAFATHGLVGGEIRNLTEPALVLTPTRVSDDEAGALLTASDIARLRLDADWVILSACNTSAGQGGAAPVFSGLARAFVQAGARALLLSQWPIRDDLAAPLTVTTVRLSAQGIPRARALRRAQLMLLADRSAPGIAHPAIWAPFVLVGE